MPLRFRKHIRLPDHDHTKGAYFVTLGTRPRMEVFGRSLGTDDTARMELNDRGGIVDQCWHAMPDHLHAILELDRGNENGDVEATPGVAATIAVNRSAPRPNGPRRGSLAAIHGAFRSETTERVNRLNDTLGRSLCFYERAIREHCGEWGRIAHCIAENPKKW